MNIKEQLKGIGSSVLGILIFVAVIVLIILFISGGVNLVLKLLPVIYGIMWIVFTVDLIVVLPLAIIKKVRVFSGVSLFISSYIYGITLWMYGLLITYVLWGFFAVFIGLFILGVGVVPIAMLASLLGGEWIILLNLGLLLFFTYGSRSLGIYFSKYEPKENVCFSCGEKIEVNDGFCTSCGKKII